MPEPDGKGDTSRADIELGVFGHPETRPTPLGERKDRPQTINRGGFFQRVQDWGRSLMSGDVDEVSRPQGPGWTRAQVLRGVGTAGAVVVGAVADNQLKVIDKIGNTFAGSNVEGRLARVEPKGIRIFKPEYDETDIIKHFELNPTRFDPVTGYKDTSLETAYGPDRSTADLVRSKDGKRMLVLKIDPELFRDTKNGFNSFEVSCGKQESGQNIPQQTISLPVDLIGDILNAENEGVAREDCRLTFVLLNRPPSDGESFHNTFITTSSGEGIPVESILGNENSTFVKVAMVRSQTAFTYDQGSYIQTGEIHPVYEQTFQ